MDGLRLTFHLAGINNQNFLMRDEETGSYWQQISGVAVSGPMAGRRLTLIHSDELTFALWKGEQPAGTALKDVTGYVDDYARKDWDVGMRKAPVVINFPEHGLNARDLMLGIDKFGEARAFPYETLVREKLIAGRLGAQPIIVVLGPDGVSVRAFVARLNGVTAEFFRDAKPAVSGPLMMDETTGSHWNFQGCAVEGEVKGTCLDRLEVIKDYWFDWRNYHPATTVYRR